MAIYHLSVTAVKRSAGRSATAGAAYRTASRVRDERSGETHDYTRKHGVESATILAPKDAPDWAHDREALWNAVEVADIRKDARVAREITVALPAELSPEGRRELVESWAQSAFVHQGMVADVAIHAPHREGDDRNHHAHVLLTTRRIDRDGFGPKEPDWNRRERVSEWRESWALAQNRALELAHERDRVDHRSYEAQGLDRLPTRHLGPSGTAMERQEEREAREEGREVERVTEEGRWNAVAEARNAALEIAREAHSRAREAFRETSERVRGLSDRLGAFLGGRGADELERGLWERSPEGREHQRELEREHNRSRGLER